MHFEISMWSYSAVLYNVLLFVPLGIFLFLLLDFNNRKANYIVVLSSLGIYFALFLFVWMGLAMSYSNVSIVYLLFNVLGGLLGVFVVKYAININYSYKLKGDFAD